jgi:hypothetical protein
MGSADDDFGTCGCNADFTTRIALFGKFPSEKFIEFGEEDAIGDELELT